MTDATDTPGTDPEDKTKGKRLTSAEWEQLIWDREYRGASSGELSKKYGISESAIGQKFKSLGEAGRPIKRGSKIHLLEKEIAEKAAKEALEKAASGTAAPAVEDTFELKRLKRVEQAKELYYGIERKNLVILVKAQKKLEDAVDAASVAEISSITKAIRNITGGVKTSKENMWSILGVDQIVEERSLPKLYVEDLSDAEIALMQSRGTDDEDEDGELVVELPEDEAS